MNPSSVWSKQAPAAAVLALALVALGAAWLGRGEPATLPAQAQVQPGSTADAPARVARSPQPRGGRQPVTCRDCGPARPGDGKL